MENLFKKNTLKFSQRSVTQIIVNVFYQIINIFFNKVSGFLLKGDDLQNKFRYAFTWFY
ncbi:hypothetical protein FM107_19875 [Sphingobacterium sp. JB170]|nr:hypothetical protein FM107_19875 [Sphingobacterium sp. JB170]